MVHEPMTDMVKLLSKLVETNGNITVPGVEEMVPQLTDKERFLLSTYGRCCWRTKVDFYSQDFEALARNYNMQDFHDSVSGREVLSFVLRRTCT